MGWILPTFACRDHETMLACSPVALIEQTSTLEEGNRGFQAIPEIIRTERMMCVCVSGLMDRVTGTLP